VKRGGLGSSKTAPNINARMRAIFPFIPNRNKGDHIKEGYEAPQKKNFQKRDNKIRRVIQREGRMGSSVFKITVKAESLCFQESFGMTERKGGGELLM